jgi:hypothetical protein
MYRFLGLVLLFLFASCGFSLACCLLLISCQAARQGPADDAAIAIEALRIRTLPFWMHVTH